MATAVQDLRYAARSLLKQPAFTLIAAGSIALGIGFNAAIFSAVNALLLRPAPGIAEPDRVIEVGRTDEGRGFDSFSYRDLVDLREGVPALEHLAAWRTLPVSFGAEEGGERLLGMAVSAGYFEALGALPARGRAFGPEEDRRGAPAVAVISDRFWKDRLGGAADVIGRTIDINRVPVTVIGVAPPSFGGHFPVLAADVWLPFERLDVAQPRTEAALFESRRYISHQVVGRLAEGATLEQANAAVSAAMARLAEAHPGSNEGRARGSRPWGPSPAAAGPSCRGSSAP